MQRFYGVMTSLCAALLAASAQTAAAAPSDEQQIRAELDAECKGFAARDAVAAMAAYVKDDRLIQFDMFPPESVDQSGYAAPVKPTGAASRSAPLYDTGYAGALKKVQEQIDGTVGPLIAEVSDFHVTVDHDHAYSRYILNFGGTLKSGQPFHMVARTTDVYQKIGGKWLIVLEHNSSPPG